MEIDPEVAELLGDLPPPRLPEACVQAEWGRWSMKQMINIGQKEPAPPTEGPQAPTFDHACVQCGRPVTMNRDHWEDHNAQRRCDGAIYDGDPLSSYHITDRDEQVLLRRQEYVEEGTTSYVYSRIKVGPPVVPKGIEPKPLKVVDCSAHKHGHSCAHQCAHDSGHFGFHECKTCRHLWR